MTVLSCRYCPLYCPSAKTPVWGHCAGVFPPLRVEAVSDSCPFGGDLSEIEKIAHSRGLSDHDLRGLLYYGVSETGIRTRFYPDLDKLLEFIRDSRLHHTIYVSFVDADKVVFYRAIIPEVLT